MYPATGKSNGQPGPRPGNAGGHQNIPGPRAKYPGGGGLPRPWSGARDSSDPGGATSKAGGPATLIAPYTPDPRFSPVFPARGGKASSPGPNPPMAAGRTGGTFQPRESASGTGSLATGRESGGGAAAAHRYGVGGKRAW